MLAAAADWYHLFYDLGGFRGGGGPLPRAERRVPWPRSRVDYAGMGVVIRLAP